MIIFDGFRPTGFKARTERNCFKLFPKWMVRDIFNNNTFPQVGRSTTGAYVWANFNAMNCLVIVIWQVGAAPKSNRLPSSLNSRTEAFVPIF